MITCHVELDDNVEGHYRYYHDDIVDDTVVSGGSLPFPAHKLLIAELILSCPVATKFPFTSQEKLSRSRSVSTSPFRIYSKLAPAVNLLY